METKIWTETKTREVETGELIAYLVYWVQTETHIYRMTINNYPNNPEYNGLVSVTSTKLKNGKPFGREFMVDGPIPREMTSGAWKTVEEAIADIKSGKKLKRL